MDIRMSDPANMEPGFTLLPPRGEGVAFTVIIDNQGEVVWYSQSPASSALGDAGIRYWLTQPHWKAPFRLMV